jgi:hypothetical protein
MPPRPPGGPGMPPRPPGGPGMAPLGRAGPGPGPGPGWDRGPIGKGNGNGNGRELGGGWSNKREADWRQPNAGGDGGGPGDAPSAKRGRWDERGVPGGGVNRVSSGWDRGPDDSGARAGPPNAGAADAGSGWDRRSNGNRSDSDSSRDPPRAPSGGGWQPPRPPPSAATADADRGASSGGSVSASSDSRGRTGWDQVRLRSVSILPLLPPHACCLRTWPRRSQHVRAFPLRSAALIYELRGTFKLAESWTADAARLGRVATTAARRASVSSSTQTAIGSLR